MLAELVLTYALFSNVPLYVREQGPPYRQSGARIEISKDLGAGFFLNLDPYLWSASEDRAGNGGAVARLGFTHKNFTILFEHESQHDFDRATTGRHIEWDVIKVRWGLN